MERPALSLCMIVRDEEAMLPGFLAAVAGLWDELVAADTGSRDGTVGLLEAVGACVVHHRWDDDFAAARNASLEAATGRWILVLDADERVTPGLADEIRGLLADPGAGAATLVMRNALPGGLHKDADLLRLFRRDPSIRFRHAIHEDASGPVASYLAAHGLAQRRLAGVVHHLGYVRDHAAARRKQDRDSAILRRLVAADPGDLYSWYKLLEQARFWGDRDLAREASAGAAAAFDAAPAPWLAARPWSGDLAALIAAGRCSDPAERLAWLEARSRCTSRTAAWHLARAGWLESAGRLEEASAALDACLAQAGPDGLAHRTRARLAQARLAAAAGRLAEAAQRAREAAGDAPADAEALLAAVAFTQVADGEAALDAFVRGHRAAAPGCGTDLARALLGAGLPERAAPVFEDAAADDPAAELGLLVCAVLTGQPFDRTLVLDGEAAGDALKDWIGVVWRSRRTALMQAFADGAGGLAAAFPWLPAHLAAETRRLAGG